MIQSGSSGCLSSERTLLRQQRSSRTSFNGSIILKGMAFSCLFFRVDGVLKHLTIGRDFDHRLRALENEVCSIFIIPYCKEASMLTCQIVPHCLGASTRPQFSTAVFNKQEVLACALFVFPQHSLCPHEPGIYCKSTHFSSSFLRWSIAQTRSAGLWTL